MRRRDFLKAVGVVALAVGETAKRDKLPEKGERKETKEHMLRIKVVKTKETDFGGDDPKDIKAVLQSVGNTILEHCPHTNLDPIEVKYQEGEPITFFKRGADGQIKVALSAGGKYWSQYALQFAHEFAHILISHSHGHDSQTETENVQLKENLCYTASIFVLRRMAETWATHPPFPNWKEYAPHLREYADNLLSDPKYAVAKQLLPIFEQHPERWEHITFLNMTPFERRVIESRHFIDRIAKTIREQPPAPK